MRVDDLDSLVAIHNAAFPGFFLTFLGADFLKLLYASIHSDAEGHVFVAESDNHLVGFVAGVRNQGRFFRRLIRRRAIAFAVASLPAVIRKPGVVGRLFRALGRPAAATQSASAACLMSLAVQPQSAARGIGSQLIEAFCERLRKDGIAAVALTTDRDGNPNTNAFYQKRGFALTRQFTTREGRAMNEYVRTLRADG